MCNDYSFLKLPNLNAIPIIIQPRIFANRSGGIPLEYISALVIVIKSFNPTLIKTPMIENVDNSVKFMIIIIFVYKRKEVI